MNFDKEKNGFNVNQVNDYIYKLKNEYERVINEQRIRVADLKRENDSLNKELDKFKSKNNNISDALVVAVETAKQIENSSKNVYELEIKRIRSLYKKWERFLNDLMKEYPKLKNKFDSESLLNEFSNKIDEIIEENSVPLEEEPKQSVGIRNLISKMGGLTSRKIETPKFTIKRSHNVSKTEQEENNVVENLNSNIVKDKIENKYNEDDKPNINNNIKTNIKDDSIPKNNLKLKIKPIANMKKTKEDKFNDLVDKFLTDDIEEENAFSKALIRKKENDGGFDLKEALNPKEDLAEIMKDFDFFDDDGKN